MSVCVFKSLCIWWHAFRALYTTAGLIYPRQAACAAYHWFRGNAVTCEDISLASACWSTAAIDVVIDIFLPIFLRRLSQWACSRHCSGHSKELDWGESWSGRTLPAWRVFKINSCQSGDACPFPKDPSVLQFCRFAVSGKLSDRSATQRNPNCHAYRYQADILPTCLAWSAIQSVVCVHIKLKASLRLIRP